MCESMEPSTPNFSPTSMDRLNNNTKELAIIPHSPSSSTTSPADFTRSRELMGALCNANPQFTASVLEDYIRPIFRLVRISSVTHVTHVSVNSGPAGGQFTVQIGSVIL